MTWNRCYHLTDIDAQGKEATGAVSHPGFLLTETWEVRTGSGTPYRVFTPFSKKAQGMLLDAPPSPPHPPLPLRDWRGSRGRRQAWTSPSGAQHLRLTAPPATVWHAVAHPEMDPDAQHLEQLARWQRGDDAAPYFRIFNPLTQQQKFDRDGAYVSRWVPEASTPAYPGPMVDVQASRKVALAAYDDIAAHH
ncbi:hypothetical protein CKJ80_04995 [Corynebacterium hadale]|uniref:Cryptochrome/DNA photolyase FAD-binding domain-containing protein n=1 Tax=Corynebacterium hadale TaxID=2026255 RepID=A0AB36RNI6_9CORY|nr:hypothetical protein CKJ80_04995 [Corynebacterium hadale]